jgi:hypothetical protein
VRFYSASSTLLSFLVTLEGGSGGKKSDNLTLTFCLFPYLTVTSVNNRVFVHYGLRFLPPVPSFLVSFSDSLPPSHSLLMLLWWMRSEPTKPTAPPLRQLG